MCRLPELGPVERSTRVTAHGVCLLLNPVISESPPGVRAIRPSCLDRLIGSVGPVEVALASKSPCKHAAALLIMGRTILLDELRVERAGEAVY